MFHPALHFGSSEAKSGEVLISVLKERAVFFEE